MKIMNKFQKKLANRKKDNKGFSLVELIIVIAIMAILVGIVGTQVLPYLNKSKEAKDVQILNSYSTAAVSAYSMLAGELTTESGTVKVDVYTDATSGETKLAAKEKLDDKEKLAVKIKELVGYSAANDKMVSKVGKTASKIEVEYNFDTHEITTKAVTTGGELDEVKASF